MGQSQKAIIVGIGLLLLIGGFFFLKGQNSLPSSDYVIPTPEPGPSLWIKPQHDARMFAAGESIQLIIYADSKGQEVSGYDVLLPLDVDTEFVGAKDLDSGLEVKAHLNKDSVLISGITSLDNPGKGIVMQGQPLALLTFKRTKVGQVEFTPVFRAGETYDSNIVVASPPGDVLTEATGTFVYVGTKKTLSKRAPLRAGDIEITLVSETTPEPQCADCTTEVSLKLTQGKEVIEHRSTFGGFMGKRFDVFEAFGTVFQVEEAEDNAYTVTHVLL